MRTVGSIRSLVAIGCLTGAARADDHAPTITLGFGVISHVVPDAPAGQVERSATGPVLVIGWEGPPAAYATEPGNRYELALVPELIGGVLRGDRPTEVLVGAGLRPELQWSQYKGGLLGLTCRGALYVAARGIVIGAPRDPMFEGVFGNYFQTRLGLRFGFEFGAVARQWSREPDVDRAGFTAQFFVGWGQGG